MKKILFILTYLLVSQSFAIERSGINLKQIVDDQNCDVWSGFKAKVICTSVFGAGRNFDDVLKSDAKEWPQDIFFAEKEKSSISVSCAPKRRGELHQGNIVKRTAYYRGPKLGCTLLARGNKIPKNVSSIFKSLSPKKDFWDDNLSIDESYNNLAEKVFNQFSNTRAFLVIKNGKLTAEKYAQGFNYSTIQAGFSMTKSVVGLLTKMVLDKVGYSVNQSLSSVGVKASWSNSVTIQNVLNMASGLNFSEDYGDAYSSVMTMAMVTGNQSQYVLRHNLISQYAPGNKFHYSSGDSVLLSHIIKTIYENNSYLGNYNDHPYDLLFNKIDMNPIFEQDESNTFAGGFYMHATARDWAKFGTLIEQEGVWEGRQVYPKEWSKELCSNAGIIELKDSLRKGAAYGSQFYTLTHEVALSYLPEEIVKKIFPNNETHDFEGVCIASGFKGQTIFIIPSLDLIVVRLGWSDDSYDPKKLLSLVLKSYK